MSRLAPVPEDASVDFPGDMNEAGYRSALRAWDPTHSSAQAERQVKIRACLDLAAVLNTVPSAFRGVLSHHFAMYTEKIDAADQLKRALKRMNKQKAKKEVPPAYNSLKLPTVHFQKGSKDQWNETWSQPAEADLVQFKLALFDREITLQNQQIVRMMEHMDELTLVKNAIVALREEYEKRPHEDMQILVPLTSDELKTWPSITPVYKTVPSPLRDELQALEVDMSVYFRKVLDLKMDTIERIHGRKDRKAEDKRKADTMAVDEASPSTKTTEETVNSLLQRQFAAREKAMFKKLESIVASSPKIKKNKVSEVFNVKHTNPTHSVSLGPRRTHVSRTEGEETEAEGAEEEEESCREGQGGSSGEETTPSWRRFRSGQAWTEREGKRKAEAEVEVLLGKPWTFGKPNSYPDGLLSLPPTYQAQVLLTRAPVSLLDANRFRSPVHVQPGLDIPMSIQHDLSASLKFMFERQVDKNLIKEAYADLVRRIRWKWFFINEVGDDYDPDYDVSISDPSKKKKKAPDAHPLIELGLKAGQDYVYECMTSIPDDVTGKRPTVPLNLERAREFLVTNNLIVTSTDKNLGVAVFKREWIYDQAHRLFDDEENYFSLTVEEAVGILSFLSLRIRELCEFHLQDKEQLSAFLSHCLPSAGDVHEWVNWRKFVPEAYAIPKIHKNPWKGRPICPGFSLPQNAASKVLAKTVRPFVDQCPWVIQGSKDFVRKLADVKVPAGRKAFIVSADVVAFYPSVDTNILHEILVKFAEHTLIPDEIQRGELTSQNVERRADYYSRLFDIALSPPIMTFNDRIIGQHKGLPMGAAGSPEAANMYAIWYELEWMDKVTNDADLLFYGRYLDDIYTVVLAETPDEAKAKVSFISLGDVKLLWEPPSDKADFLDLSTRLELDGIYHEPFVKAMSHRERIPWSSAHPLDVKRGTFSSEISRLATLCSARDTFDQQCEEAVNLYIGRGYPPATVRHWLKGQKEKRWEGRLSVKTDGVETTNTFFTLKTHFNDAWKYFNVGELQTRVTAHWKDLADPTRVAGVKRGRTAGVDNDPRQRKRVRIALQGQQWPGQARLAFTQEENSNPVDGIRLTAASEYSVNAQSLVDRKAAEQWTNNGKFLVSRRKNTQLWDLTRTWNKTIWDAYLEQSGALRPFDPAYEGLVIPNHEDN